MVEKVIANCQYEISSGFIAESAKKLQKIVEYYGALHAQNPFPSVKCNAPWVSVSIEADGTVRPCFFHKKIGNIRNLSLGELLNSPEAMDFRRNLNVSNNEICRKCVCTLNYKP
jgi:MoaA/NifB/PqqE/SkfB family radical SAM enzyme